jgi:hypothetical protein
MDVSEAKALKSRLADAKAQQQSGTVRELEREIEGALVQARKDREHFQAKVADANAAHARVVGRLETQISEIDSVIGELTA